MRCYIELWAVRLAIDDDIRALRDHVMDHAWELQDRDLGAGGR